MARIRSINEWTRRYRLESPIGFMEAQGTPLGGAP
jgi:hypothetical protein